MGISVKIDDRDGRPGPKFYEWERKGVPLRIEIGPKDIENKSILVARRDTGEKQTIGFDELNKLQDLLKTIQDSLYQKALTYRKEKTYEVSSYDEFKKIFDGSGTGFVSAHWCGDAECENKIKEETTATIRLIDFEEKEEGKCVYCGNKAKTKAIFAKAY